MPKIDPELLAADGPLAPSAPGLHPGVWGVPSSRGALAGVGRLV